jgi:WD40 repeat protein
VATNAVFDDIVVSGGGDDCAFLWSLEDGMLAHVLKGHADSINAAAFNFTGDLVATGSLDHTVKVWKVDTGALIATLDGPGDAIQWLAWHPRGNVLIAGVIACHCYIAFESVCHVQAPTTRRCGCGRATRARSCACSLVRHALCVFDECV